MRSLDLYHAKRDFTATSEPRGRVERGSGKALRFVVQKHAATRLHYDFRIELDGVYKSWAVTKVPALDPATKRLAVEVEDHPLDYGTFEGTIPQGQYGGGAVQLWDTGTWEPQGDNPRKSLEDGHLKLILHGKRLQGSWALIRLRDEAARPGRKTRHNWLLIKEKDDAAHPGEPDALLKHDTSVKTGRTLDEIAGAKRGKVWQSNRASKAEPKTAAPRAKKAAAKKAKPRSAKKKTRVSPRPRKSKSKK